MTYQSRSEWELSGNPVADHLTREERSDHHRAAARGARVLLLADSLVAALAAGALLTDEATARPVLFHRLADELYGGASIDVPNFRSEDSLAAFRRGTPDE